MKKFATLSALLVLVASAHAEWFQVQKVTSYNQIAAIRPNAPANTITIRIRNLENIEDIQQNRTKVLLSGKSAQRLAKDCLEGQLVWIEELQEESGIFTGNIYLSYEQVVRGFARQRMVGGQTLSPEIKSTIDRVYDRMLKSMDSSTSSAFENSAILVEANKKAADGKDIFSCDSCYNDDYLKGIFVYEALVWFKETGQFLPENIQKLYVDWLSQYQSAPNQRAQIIEMKIRGLVVRYKLFEDFIADE